MDENKALDIIIDLEEKRKGKYRGLLILGILSLALLVTGVIFLILGFAALKSVGFAGAGIGLVLVGFILVIVAQIYKKNFRNYCLDMVFNEFAQNYYKDPFRNAKAGLNESVLRSAEFYKHWDRYIGSDYFKGSYKNINFEMCRYELQDEHHDSQNHSTSYSTFDKGILIKFTLLKNINHDLTVLERSFNFGAKMVSSKNKIEFESMEFNKQFNTYCDDKLYAFYLITPQIQERFIQVNQNHKGDIRFRLVGDTVYFGVSNYRSDFKFKTSKPFDEETIRGILSEFLVPMMIVDELKLDSDKLNDESRGNI